MTTAAAPAARDYSGATRECDVVMKGGITSGIVYPLAVCELARTYRFVNIGGTSAGAIAAAATAAAEYGRAHGQPGFSGLESLPAELGADGTLLSLFQPTRGTHRIFAVLLAGITSGRRRALRVVVAVIRQYWFLLLVGALPGLLLFWLAVSQAGGWLRAASIAGALSMKLVGVVVALCVGAVAPAARAVVRNGYGMCTGMAGFKSRRPALTPWLTDLLNRLAGKTVGGVPLTFGDLSGVADATWSVNLEMETTCLTHGRPYRLPFRERIFYFEPTEFRRYFPDAVVDWMVGHAPTDDVTYGALLRLPDANDLPVVVGARMSLSFPLLISAVPLYAIDYSSDAVPVAPERVWFSDGGISSNFPVHLFDAPFPKRPTFAINLRPYHPSHPTTDVWLPTKNSQGILTWWTRFDATPSIGSFLGAIMNAMQNWHDNVLLGIPGYRDRIVHISLDDTTEGGLNLNMPDAVIRALSNRGMEAGKLLVTRYAGPPEPGVDVSWPNHRWVRYRTMMAVLQRGFEQLASVIAVPGPGDPGYVDFVRDVPADGPASYALKNTDAAAGATAKLGELPDDWHQLGLDFTKGAPRPELEMRLTPRV